MRRARREMWKGVAAGAPRQHPVQVYGRALAAHLAFGLTTEALTPLARRALDRLTS